MQQVGGGARDRRRRRYHLRLAAVFMPPLRPLQARAECTDLFTQGGPPCRRSAHCRRRRGHRRIEIHLGILLCASGIRLAKRSELVTLGPCAC